MGNTATLREYLCESSSASEGPHDSMTTGDRHVSWGDARPEPTPLPDQGAHGGSDGGSRRLWEVEPIDFNDSASEMRPLFQVKGLAAQGAPLSQNDDDNSGVADGTNSPYKLKSPHGNEHGGNNSDEQIYVDTRLPTVMDDMPILFEDGSSSEGGERRRIAHDPSGDSSTLEPKGGGGGGGGGVELSSSSLEHRTTFCSRIPRVLRLIFACFCILFLVLLAVFLFFMFRDENDDNGTNRDVDVNFTSTPVPTSVPATLPPPAPTLMPTTVAPTMEPIVVERTTFPTFAIHLWEAVGSAIALPGGSDDDDGSWVGLSLSFDGRVLITLTGTTLQAYQWQSLAWRPRGSAVGATISGAGTRNPPGVALSTVGNVVAWGDPTTGTVHVLEWKSNEWHERPEISLVAVDADANGGATESDAYTFAFSASGNVLAIGEPFAQSSAGRAHLFRWNVSEQTWTLIRTWTGSTGSRTGSAISLSLDGRTMAVGAVENALSTIVPGMVRVYRQQSNSNDNSDGSVWAQVGQTLVGIRDGDRFGESVALSGSGQHLAVGAPAYESKESNNGLSLANAGQVRVFKWDSNKKLWEPGGQSLVGTYAERGLGQIVSLSNNAQILVAGGITGGLQIHRLNDSERWIPWGLSGVSAPSLVTNAALAGNGKVVALADGTNGDVHIYQAVSW